MQKLVTLQTIIWQMTDLTTYYINDMYIVNLDFNLPCNIWVNQVQNEASENKYISNCFLG